MSEEKTPKTLEEKRIERELRKAVERVETIKTIAANIKICDIEKVELNEVLKDGSPHKEIVLHLFDTKEEKTITAKIPYEFEVDHSSNSIHFTPKKSERSAYHSLFGTEFEPKYHNEGFLFALDKDSQEESRLVMEALQSSSVLTLKGSSVVYAVTDISSKLVPFLYDFKHLTLEAPIHFPKKDEPSPREIEQIAHFVERLAASFILSETDNDISRELANNSDFLNGPEGPIRELEKALDGNLILKNELIETEISLKGIKKLNDYKKAAPIFFDYSGSGKGEYALNSGVKFKLRHLFAEDESKKFVLDEAIESNLPNNTHDSKHVTISLLKSIHSTSSSFIDSSSKTVKNSLARIATSSDHRNEMTPSNTVLDGVIFWKFDSEDAFVDAMMDENTPYMPAMFDGKFYMVSVPVVRSYEYKTDLQTAMDYVKKLKKNASKNNGLGWVSPNSSIYYQIRKKASYMITNTGKGQTIDLNEVFEKSIKKEISLIPNVAAVQGYVKAATINSLVNNFTMFDSNLPVFPNIVNVGGRNVSFNQMLKNRFLLNRYLQMPNISDVIKMIAKNRDEQIPDVKPFICYLADPSLNNMKDSEKEVVFDLDSARGVLDFKYIPGIYSLESHEDKKVFIELCTEATKNSFSDIEDKKEFEGLELILEHFVSESSYAVIQSEKIFDESDIISKERLVLIDKSLQIKKKLPVPVFGFIEEAKKRQIIDKSYRAKNVVIRKADMDKMFDSVIENMKRDIVKDKDFYTIAAKLFAGQIKRENLARVEKNYNYNTPSFLLQRSMKFYMDLKESGLTELEAKTFVSPPLSAEKIANIYFEKNDPLNKKTIEILKRIYEGKEFSFAGIENMDQKKDIIYKLLTSTPHPAKTTDDIKEIVDLLYGTLQIEGGKDIKIIEGCTSLINNYAFVSYVNILTEKNPNALTAENKQSLFVTMLRKNYRLRDKQIVELMGALSMYLAGDVERIAAILEMRFGKTMMGLAALDILSVMEKSASMFYLQGKTLDDVLSQAYFMNPSIIKHHASVIGNQSLFNIQSSKYPLAITEHIFDNIPVNLKRYDILRNPDPASTMAPSELMAKNYQKELSLLLSYAESLNDKDFKAIVEKNKALFNDAEELFKNVPDSAVAKDVSKTLYLYIVSAIKKGFIDNPNQNPEANEAILKTSARFWKDYSRELDNMRDRRSETIFIAKQHISTLLGSNVETKREKIKDMSAYVFLENDVQYDYKKYLSHAKQDDEILDQGREKMNDFIDVLKLPEQYLPAEDSEAIIPMLNFSKIAVKSAVKQRTKTEFIANFRRFSKNEITSKVFDILENLNLELPLKGTVEYASLQFAIDGLIRSLAETTDRNNKGVLRELALPYLSYAHKNENGFTLDIKERFGEMVKAISAVFPQESVNIQANFNKKVKDFTDIVSNAGYKALVNSIYAPKDSTSKFRDRMDIFIASSDKKTVHDIGLNIFIGSAIDSVCLPQKIHASKKNETSTFIDVLNFYSEIPTPEDPTESTMQGLYPQEIEMTLQKSSWTIFPKDFISKENNATLPKNKKFRSNLNAPTLWMTEGGRETKKISCIVTDEVQQNTSKTQLEALESINSIGEGRKLSIMLSGSALEKQKNFAATLSQITPGDYGNNVGLILRELARNCGIFKTSIDTLSFLLIEGRKAPEFNEILSSAILEATHLMYNTNRNVNIYNITEEAVTQIYNSPVVMELKKNFEALYNIYLGSHQMKDELEIILRSTASVLLRDISISVTEATAKRIKEIKEQGFYDEDTKIANLKSNTFRDFLEKEEIGIPTIEFAVLSTDSGITTQAPGSCNFLAMPTITEGIPGAYISVKSNDAAYNVLDDLNADELKEKHSRQFISPTYSISLLAYAAALKKYRAAYSIGSVYNTYSKMISVALKGLRENSVDTLGLSIADYNGLVNRTKKARPDGFLDDIYRLVVEHREIPAEKTDIFNKVLESVNYQIEHYSDIQSLRRSLDEQEEASLEFLPGFKTNVKTTDISGIEMMHTAEGEPAHLKPYQTKSSDGPSYYLTQKGIVYSPDGILDQDNLPAHRLPIFYKAPVTIKPFEDLPSLSFEVNIRLQDDASLFELASTAKETSALFKKHIDNNENTRQMTSRTTASKLAVLTLIDALMNREDMSMTHNILINATNNEIQDLIDELTGHNKYIDILKSNKINIVPFKPTMKAKENEEQAANQDEIKALPLFKAIQTVMSKGEKLHVVSNAGSIAAGIDLSMVDTGFYMGIVNDVQSYARQINESKKYSNFYLFNDHHYKNLDVPLSHRPDNYRKLYETSRKGLNTGCSEKTLELNAKEMSSSSYPLDMSRAKLNTRSYLVMRNKGVLANLRSFQSIMTGKIDTKDLSRLAIDEKIHTIKDMAMHDDAHLIQKAANPETAKAVSHSPSSSASYTLSASFMPGVKF